MANPVVVACPVDTWKIVATNVTSGVIHPLASNAQYLHTYVMTGGAAPTGTAIGVQFLGSLKIAAAAGIDVYVYAQGNDGSVRADL